jgi:hypothetical protein
MLDGLELLGMGELFENNDLTTFLFDLVCSEESASEGICKSAMFALIGYDPVEVNEVRAFPYRSSQDRYRQR